MVNGLLPSVQVTLVGGPLDIKGESEGLASFVDMRENCMEESALGPSI